MKIKISKKLLPKIVYFLRKYRDVEWNSWVGGVVKDDEIYCTDMLVFAIGEAATVDTNKEVEVKDKFTGKILAEYGDKMILIRMHSHNNMAAIPSEKDIAEIKKTCGYIGDVHMIVNNKLEFTAYFAQKIETSTFMGDIDTFVIKKDIPVEIEFEGLEEYEKKLLKEAELEAVNRFKRDLDIAGIMYNTNARGYKPKV